LSYTSIETGEIKSINFIGNGQR